MSSKMQVFVRDAAGRSVLTQEGAAELRRQLGLPVAASAQQIAAAIADPPAGSEFQRRVRSIAVANGVRAGVIAAGRREAWEQQFDTDRGQTLASLATTARMSASEAVKQRAEAEIAAASAASKDEPGFVLGCYARATVAVAPKPAARPKTTTARLSAAPSASELADASRQRMGGLAAASDDTRDHPGWEDRDTPWKDAPGQQVSVSGGADSEPTSTPALRAENAALTLAGGSVRYHGLPTKMSATGTRQVFSGEG
jgi:hypothetical protein